MQPKIKNLCIDLQNKILQANDLSVEQICFCISEWFLENKILSLMDEYKKFNLDKFLYLNFNEYPTELSLYGESLEEIIFGVHILKNSKEDLLNIIKSLDKKRNLSLVFDELIRILSNSVVVSVDFDKDCNCPEWLPSKYKIMLDEISGKLVFACANCEKKFYVFNYNGCETHGKLIVPTKKMLD